MDLYKFDPDKYVASDVKTAERIWGKMMVNATFAYQKLRVVLIWKQIRHLSSLPQIYSSLCTYLLHVKLHYLTHNFPIAH